MSQGNQKKFLTVYFAVLGVGAVALGYFAFSSSSDLSAAKEKHDSQVKALEALRGAKVYPNPEGVEKKTAQVSAMRAEVEKLQAKASSFQNPLVEDDKMTGSDLLNKLAKLIKDQTDYAKQGATVLGQGFDLGLGRYSAQAPRSEIAPKINFWLEGISNLTKIIVDSGARSIEMIEAPEIALEKAESAPAPTAKPKTVGVKTSAKGPAASAAPVISEGQVIERYPVKIVFGGRNGAIVKAIAAIANTKEEAAGGKYFYAVRQYRIENEKKAGPERTLTVTEKDEQDDLGNKHKADAQMVMGSELVKVYAEIEIIRFLPEETPAASGDKTAK